MTFIAHIKLFLSALQCRFIVLTDKGQRFGEHAQDFHKVCVA